MNELQLTEKWREIIATANNEDPDYSYNLFKGLLEDKDKEVQDKVKKLKDKLDYVEVYDHCSIGLYVSEDDIDEIFGGTK